VEEEVASAGVLQLGRRMVQPCAVDSIQFPVSRPARSKARHPNQLPYY